MEKNSKKPEILKISSVLNWTLQNFQRVDDTRDALLRLERNPPQHSLRPINKICTQIANREIDLDQSKQMTAHYDGYLRMAADEIVPKFYDYIISSQIIATREFDQEKEFRFQIGTLPDGASNYVKIEPTYFSIERDFVVPTFVLGWTRVKFDLYRKRLSSSIIYRSLLTRQDFLGSDARVITYERHRWSRHQRDQGGWLISQYADMSDDELQSALDRYDKALRQVLEILSQ